MNHPVANKLRPGDGRLSSDPVRHATAGATVLQEHREGGLNGRYFIASNSISKINVALVGIPADGGGCSP